MSDEVIAEPVGKVRSCANCPSFLKADAVKSHFGSHTNMDHCGRFGKILGMPGMHDRQAEGLRRHTAKTCTSYGMPLPRNLSWEVVAAPATLPSHAAFSLEMSRNEETLPVENCRECVFYNRRGAEQAGVRGGAICSSLNQFVFDGQVYQKPQECGSSMRVDYTKGQGQVDEQIKLSPELVDAFFKVMTPLERWKAERENFVDPSEYASDREVTPEDSERGIRAWREIIDVDSENSVFMPIYDIEKLPKELQDLVPRSGDDEHPENFIDYDGLVYLLSALWYELDETPTLWGYAGTGKTEILRHMAWLMQLPFHRISITASTELEELVGQFALRDNRTEFVHGRLPRAWRSPGVICLDEPNVGPPEVWQAIRPLTDNSKQFVIDKNAGEVIRRHPDSFLGLAMNPAWDTRNIGADLIADADSSRLAHLSVNYPPEEIEREIMREWANDEDAGFAISDDTLSTIVKISTVLREFSRDSRLTVSWGVRHNIKVAKASRLFSLEKAYSIAIGNYLAPEERDMLIGTVRAHVK